MSQLPDGVSLMEDPTTPAERQRKWLGEPVLRYASPTPLIGAILPRFERRPFALETRMLTPQAALWPTPLFGENPYYDTVVRLPTDEREDPMPVGIVSKRYRLVQHREVLDTILHALRGTDIDPEMTTSEVEITCSGSRMLMHVLLPQKYEFDPGDRHPMGLRLECFNSVDGSTRFQVLMGWYRFVCSNGMVVGTTQLRFRYVHNYSLSLDDIPRVLASGLALIAQDREACRHWLQTPIDESRLVAWVDGPVRDRWGVLAAARAYHIARSGHDAVFLDRFEKALPHSKSMANGAPVPGVVAPARNAFSLSQVISWLVQDRRELQERTDRLLEIPDLLNELIGGKSADASRSQE